MTWRNYIRKPSSRSQGWRRRRLLNLFSHDENVAINRLTLCISTCSRRVLKHRRTIRRKQLKAYLLLFIDKIDVIRGGLFTRTYIIVGGCLCVYIHIYINSCNMFYRPGVIKVRSLYGDYKKNCIFYKKKKRIFV